MSEGKICQWTNKTLTKILTNNMLIQFVLIYQKKI